MIDGPAGSAEEMAGRLSLVLADALAIEGWPYEVEPVAGGMLRLVGCGERYEVRVVKKRS